MKNKTNSILICFILIFFILYGIFIFNNNSNLANWSSMICTLLVNVAIIINRKHIDKNRRILNTSILLYTGAWLLGDIIWLIYENFMPDVSILKPISNAIYLVGNFCIILILMTLISLKLKYIDKIQLIFDFVALAFVMYFIFKEFLRITFTNISFSLESINDGTVTMLFDLLLLTLLVLIYFSFIKKIKSKVTILNIATVTFFAIIDFSYVYLAAKGVYDENEVTDLMYMVPPLMFCISTMIEAKVKTSFYSELDIKENMLVNTNTSYVVSTMFIILFIIDLVFYSLGKISVSDAFYILIIMILYLFFSMNHKVNAKNRELLKYQQMINIDLEHKIEERTKDLKIINEQLLLSINTDALTKVGSRGYLISVLNEKDFLADYDCVLFIVDIVKFKNINYTLGHSVGDEILIYVASTLTNMFGEDSVFRTDSNEFAVLISKKCEDLHFLEECIRKISTTILGNYIYKRALDLNIAIGCDFSTSNNPNTNDLLKNAEFACKKVKEKYDPINNYRFYDEELANSVNRVATIESLLQRINFDKEFKLNFQPKLFADGKTLIGMESLLRWYSPILGFVSPGEFIPIAENTGTIIKIVKWTMKKSIEQIKYWNEKYATNYSMSINISPRYLETSSFLEDIKSYINDAKIPTSWLDFEITEMSIMSIGEDVINLFKTIDDMNIKVSIDDFGTGYSSLSYIKNLKIDNIKIAKELIDNINIDKSGYMIVNSVIMMAHALGVRTIAEGVETADQRDALINLNCDEIQGYFYGKPVVAEEFEENFIKKFV